MSDVCVNEVEKWANKANTVSNIHVFTISDNALNGPGCLI